MSPEKMSKIEKANKVLGIVIGVLIIIIDILAAIAINFCGTVIERELVLFAIIVAHVYPLIGK